MHLRRFYRVSTERSLTYYKGILASRAQSLYLKNCCHRLIQCMLQRYSGWKFACVLVNLFICWFVNRVNAAY